MAANDRLNVKEFRASSVMDVLSPRGEHSGGFVLLPDNRVCVTSVSAPRRELPRRRDLNRVKCRLQSLRPGFDCPSTRRRAGRQTRRAALQAADTIFTPGNRDHQLLVEGTVRFCRPRGDDRSVEGSRRLSASSVLARFRRPSPTCGYSCRSPLSLIAIVLINNRDVFRNACCRWRVAETPRSSQQKRSSPQPHLAKPDRSAEGSRRSRQASSSRGAGRTFSRHGHRRGWRACRNCRGDCC